MDKQKMEALRKALVSAKIDELLATKEKEIMQV